MIEGFRTAHRGVVQDLGATLEEPFHTWSGDGVDLTGDGCAFAWNKK